MSETLLCPCGSGEDFNRCCGPCLQGAVPAATAEQLMRSRYTAYVNNNEDYLLATWHESTRPQQLELASETPNKWLGLKIVTKQAGGIQDNEGTVEFIARYKVNGKAHRLHEHSRFIRQQGQWFYLSGEQK